MSKPPPDTSYYGYASESDYHEAYSLGMLLEFETDPTEREAIQARLTQLEASRVCGAGCTGFC